MQKLNVFFGFGELLYYELGFFDVEFRYFRNYFFLLLSVMLRLYYKSGKWFKFSLLLNRSYRN